MVLYDIKHMNEENHLKEIGTGNKIILENLVNIAGKTEIRISLPLVPGFNDDEENIVETARFAHHLNIRYIDINPLHMLGRDKFSYLGLTDHYKNYRQVTKEDVNKTRKIIEKFGIKTTVGRMM